MKIIQLVYHLGFGGGEKFVVNLSNYLAEQGHDVTLAQLRNDNDVFDIHFNRQFLSHKVKYVNLGLTKGFSLKKVFKVCRFLSDLNPDIVHSHLNLIPYYIPLAIKKSNIHFVHTIHNVAHKETSSPYLQRLNKWLFRTKRVVPVTISEECRKSYVELYNLTSPACINNGTPKMEKSYFFDSVGEEIKQLKHTPYSKILIHVGRFNEQKNHGMMINTINRLVNNGTDIELIIIGGGFESEKGKKLQAYACDRIHFLGTKSNVGDYMLHSDYFIMSSLWEGLPISIIESMSIGLPVISTPAGGIPNVITDGYTGFLSHDFSEEDFFNTISHALYTKLDPMEIYNEYRAHFSMDACASAYLSLYQNI